MNYKDIKGFNARCNEHPDHQFGMVSDEMLKDRLFEEIDELRAFIEQREWVGLTDEEIAKIYLVNTDAPLVSRWDFARAIEAASKEKNT